MNQQDFYRRPSGLIIPTIRSYEDALRLVVSVPALEGMSRQLQPVIIVDDVSGIGQSAKNTTPAPASIATVSGGAVTQPAQGYPASALPGNMGFVCHFYKDEGAGGLGAYSYTVTCPAGEIQVWHSIAWVGKVAAATPTDTLRIFANPLGPIDAAYGAGKLNYIADDVVMATTIKSQYFTSPSNMSAVLASAPYLGTSSGASFDGGDGGAAAAVATRQFIAPLVLYPGGQLTISHSLSASTFTGLRHGGWFSVFYL